MSEATRPFEVDLRGIVDLFSRHLYSHPGVYLRELLQNGHDAVQARRLVDPGAPPGELRISPAGAHNPFSFADNGIGLTADEASELLATVGRSSKRDPLLGLRRSEYLGQFGIGLLSCFLVADTIEVRSRSARGGHPIEWIGSAAGRFTVRTLSGPEAEAVAVGTTVTLQPRPDDAVLVGAEQVRLLAARYGRHLPAALQVRDGLGWDTITEPAWFLEPDAAHRPETAEWASEWLGAPPLATIPLSVPATGTRGVGFVLGRAPGFSGAQSHQVYLGRMLLTERLDDLLPPWAFFVRCVLNTDGLSPTAAREALIEDDVLAATRAELGQAIRRWVLELATTDPAAFAQFVAIHEVALKAIALEDMELAGVLVPHLVMETSAGPVTLGALARGEGTVRYAQTRDEFRQLAPIAAGPIVNAGHTFDVDLLHMLTQVIPGVAVERVRVDDLIDELEPPTLGDHDLASALAERASAALREVDCEVTVRSFLPASVPGLVVIDPSVARRLDRRRTATRTTPVWAQMLGQLDAVAAEAAPGDRPPPRVRLCLNWANPVVRELADLGDEPVGSRAVQLLYVQALLAGHHAMSATDRSLMERALSDLIHLSLPPS